jgi:hypothetical protein
VAANTRRPVEFDDLGPVRLKGFAEPLAAVRVEGELRDLGYSSGNDAVRRYAARWRRQQSATTAALCR